MKRILYFFEKKAFGVCTWLGDILGISTNVIRLYFIYASFIAFGSPIIIYLALAFWMNLKKYFRKDYFKGRAI
ncbi:MAG: PspC family transcriptional regulator [Thalassobius sp.]|nr:PspC family transcriptional regulator [Thalassovita sp.]